ncbi:toxic anion resistance protein [Campylobacter jejuni]|nr:toxic anion resistance protein [Campylobacter jejuni]
MSSTQQYEAMNEKVMVLLKKDSEKSSAVSASPLIKISMDQLKNTDNGEVYKKLDELQVLIDNVSPYRNKSVFGKAGVIPKILSKAFRINHLSRYIDKFENSSKLIDNIILYLNKSKEELENDNKALKLEIEGMAIKRNELKNLIEELSQTQQECDEYLSINKKDEFEINRFKSDTYFPLLQKMTDVKQRVMVMEQSVIAFTTLIANNRELIVSLDRAKEVTVEALGVAILMAQSLSEQERILNSVNGLNRVTSDLIKQTSTQLKNQGASIQIQASSAMLDMQALETSFKECLESFEKIKDFRIKATDDIKKHLQNFDKLMDEINSKNMLINHVK